MPRQKTTPKRKTQPKKRQKAEWIGYINYTLQESDKLAIKAMEFDQDKAFEVLQEFADFGYKVSVFPSNDGANYGITVYGYYDDLPNAGYALTVWHGTLVRCAEILVHLHTNVCTGGSWEELKDRDSLDW